MPISPDQYEKLGTFYLGREYDLASKQVKDDLILYDSKDLVTHGVVLGMTGSGKTGLCLSLLEEAAMDGVPVIATRASFVSLAGGCHLRLALACRLRPRLETGYYPGRGDLPRYAGLRIGPRSPGPAGAGRSRCTQCARGAQDSGSRCRRA